MRLLTYSVDDQRRCRPNPTKIPIDGDPHNNLASYKNAIGQYRAFRAGSDASDRTYSPKPPRPTSTAEAFQSFPFVEDPKTLIEFQLDGFRALEALLTRSAYGSVEQVVASLAVFSHPGTVRQTSNRALFPVIRDARRRGQFAMRDGRHVMFDDNKSATDAFRWANRLGPRRRDTQFNHIYAASLDPDAFTALPNLCMTPSFLAKLTDSHPHVKALLRFRVFDLYGWTPSGFEEPPEPAGYRTLAWAETLPPVANVRATLETAMKTKPEDRTVRAARQLGWLFGAPQSEG